MQEEYFELPEFLKEMIERGEQIDEIRLDSEGNWTHNGRPFQNQKIIDFFHQSIFRTRDGQYVLHYGDFTYPITVDDAPFIVTGVRFTGFGDFEQAYITLKSGVEEELDPDSLYFKRADNSLYCMVRGGTMPAKFLRSPSFCVLERLEESEDTFHLTICGKRIVLREKDQSE